MLKKKFESSTPRVVVLYEPQTGKVRHLHYSVSAPGEELPSDASLETRALELAARLQRLPSESVHALHVDATALVRGYRHRVDVETKSLISEPRTQRRG